MNIVCAHEQAILNFKPKKGIKTLLVSTNKHLMDNIYDELKFLENK